MKNGILDCNAGYEHYLLGDGMSIGSLDECMDKIMPFGKYKGHRMGDLPLGYIKWLAENINETTEGGKEICLIADKLFQYFKEDE